MCKNKHLHLKHLLLTLILTIPTLYSSEQTEVADKYYASRSEALKAAETATRENYPDADAVILNQTQKIEYDKDGTNTQWEECYMKILTEKGRKDNLTVVSFYTIPYQNPEDCRIDMIEIIHEDGTTETVNIAKESSTSINSSSMKSNIYNPNNKMITVNVSNLKVNDILHYKMYDKTVLPLAKGIYEDIFSFESTRPIINKELRINGPKSFPLQKIAICDKIPGTIKFSEQEKDNKINYKWIGQNIPQTIPEPDMPPMYSCAQRLLVSTAKNWEEISRWYWELSEKAIADTNESMKKEVVKLTAGAKTPEEKISRIFKFVSQNIRYMGITTEKVSPGREPHPVSQTFEAKYGVCRDKAALLTAMLRLAGIEAFPVLINSNAKKDTEVPLSFFDHAIAAAKVNNNYILMDPTDENTQKLLPSYLNDKSYLVATPEGETLMTSMVTPAEENLVIIETTGELKENGNLIATSSLHFNGINDNLFRGYFSRITPEERKRYFETVVRRIYGSGTITECAIEPEDLLDTSQQFKVNITYHTGNILAQGKGVALMPAPFISSIVGLTNNIFHATKLEKRRFPLKIDFTSGVKESVKISLSPEIKKIISMPIYSPIESKNIKWKRSLAEVKNNIIGSNEFLINTPEFSPEKYLELKKNLRVIEYNSRKKTVLAINEETPEVIEKARNSDIISNINITCNILSENSWEITEETKKRILTYAGKKDNSEIIINYNPIWEKVELIEAIVTSKSGEMKTINPQEINIMDQPWNGLAPRYPGGKTLIASLPGVNIGSLVEYKIKYTYTNRPFFSLQEIFQDYNPLSKTIIIKNSKNLKIQNLWNAPQHRFNIENNQYKWSMTTKPIKKELFLAPASSFLPTVAVSDGNWYSYRNIIKDKLISAASEQSLSIKKAKELTKDINDGILQIKTIRDFIAKNIRLAGPSFSHLPLSSISTADKTLTDGYGNTTDRAILFYAMLKAIDKEPEFYITTPYTAAEGLKTPILKNPQNNLFKNVLIKVKHNKNTIWLNDTSEYAHIGTTPSEGKIAFELQTGTFTEITVDQTAITGEDTFIYLELNDNSDATITIIKKFFGTSYEKYNRMFSEMTPEEVKIFYQKKLTEIAQSAVADSELKRKFTTYPGTITYRAKVPKYAVKDNNYLYFKLPATLSNLFSLRADSRENPLFINKNINKEIHILIAQPKSFRIPEITPLSFKWVSPLFNGSIETESILITPIALRNNNLAIPINELGEDLIRTLKDSRNALYITFDANVSPALYPAALYSQVLKAQNKLSIPSAKEIMLTVSASEKKD